MSKDTITVNMNVHDIPIVIEALDKANKEIERLNKSLEEQRHFYLDKLQQKENIIKEVREYIENNDLYEQDYDYDYEENLVVGPPSDETARKILLQILDKGEINSVEI